MPAPAATDEGQAATPAPAVTGEGQTATPAPAATDEGQAATSAPAVTGEGQAATSAPAVTGEGQSATPAPAATGEGQTTTPAPAATGEGQTTTPASSADDGQVITAKEFNDFFTLMHEKDWQRASSLAENLITRDAPAQRFLIARIRYAYIYVLVAQFDEDKISIKAITSKVKALQGKMVIQPWHPIKSGDVECKNMICNDPQWKDMLFTVQTNRDKSVIYWLEYVNTGKHLDLSSYNGKIARLGGILKDFSFNDELVVKPRSDVGWYFKLDIENGFIQYNR